MDQTYATHYQKLVQLVADNDEEGVQAFVRDVLPELPEQVQGEILLTLIGHAVEKQNDETEKLSRLREDGLAALEALEEVENEKKGGPSSQ